LDGNGVVTTSLTDGTHFSYNGDGFAQLTGWVDPHDGFLVIDTNGDGIINDAAELFGDQTILADGTRAPNGFMALSGLDSNGDGKITAADQKFAQLRVWRDLNGDGFSEENELFDLDELGITSITLDSVATNVNDLAGNTQNRLGSFTWVDGTTGQIAEYTFQQDSMETISNGLDSPPDDVAALPYLSGSGNVGDLYVAMVADTSGVLKSLVEQFVTAGDSSARGALLDQILFKWTGCDTVDPESRGPYMDGRKLATLEKFFGDAWSSTDGPNPGQEAAPLLNDAYRDLSEMMCGLLMFQTHLKDWWAEINLVVDDDTQHVIGVDLSAVATGLTAHLADNPEQGRQLLGEFARSIRSIGLLSKNEYLSFRETFIQQDPSLDSIIDTGGLAVYDQLGQSPDGWFDLHMFGTWGSDAVQGSATEGDGYINGLSGDDVLYGTDRSENIFQQDGDALIVAGGGSDTIWAGAGNDILDGGTGNDLLFGEAGNDTYILRTGSGRDTIIDADPTPDNVDTIWLGGNLTPDDIALKRVGANLVLSIINSSDSLTVRDHFKNDSTLNRIEQIQFMDGTVWDEAEIIARVYAPTEGDDVIYGGPDVDALNGLGGNDTIFGREEGDTLNGGTEYDSLFGEAGNDTLRGGEGIDTLVGGPGDDVLEGAAGNDTLDGGTGNDTYRFGRGSGQDTVIDKDTTPGAIDTVLLEEGILPTDIRVERIGNDLKLTIIDTLDTLTVKDWLQGDTISQTYHAHIKSHPVPSRRTAEAAPSLSLPFHQTVPVMRLYDSKSFFICSKSSLLTSPFAYRFLRMSRAISLDC